MVCWGTLFSISGGGISGFKNPEEVANAARVNTPDTPIAPARNARLERLGWTRLAVTGCTTGRAGGAVTGRDPVVIGVVEGLVVAVVDAGVEGD
jgi:hypothetical protein